MFAVEITNFSTWNIPIVSVAESKIKLVIDSRLPYKMHLDEVHF